MNKLINAPLAADLLSQSVYQPLYKLPESERPHARILREGAMVCSTPELLQVIIGGPHAEFAARVLLGECNDLHGLANKSLPELTSIVHGVGPGKATVIKACLELGKRMVLASLPQRLLIKMPCDAAQLFIAQMGLLDREEVWTLLLDARNRVITSPMIYRGTLSTANMRVCEIFRDAIRHNSASLILAHNHPSGDLAPSSEDVLVTTEVIKAGKLLDIEVLDHLVIAGPSFVSLKERGLGFE